MMTDHMFRAWFWRAYLLLVIVGIMAAVLALTGCATVAGPVYTPPVLINGFDPTLSSHAEALGLKEPRQW